MQFAVIVITFFILSLNAVAAPSQLDDLTANPLLDYNPDVLVTGSRDVNQYVPIIASLNPDEVADQVLSSVVGPETSYAPKPMLVETVDHQTADRIRRGLRKETVSHTVAQGETLSKIASSYGINVATLLESNGIKPEDTLKIKPGTQLAIAPENTTQSTDWLDKLHEQERKAREERDRLELERKAKLASSRSNSLSRIAKASAADEAATGSGNFRRPISAGCQNGYHWYAIDCPASPGTAIFAAAGGVVEVADTSGFNGGYGKTIVINHGNGWETRYAHMSTVNVVSGDRVGAGEVIGGVGNTGRSTGPHLHFETIKNGQRLNPVNVLGR